MERRCMANLDYLTNFLPFSWHEAQLKMRQGLHANADQSDKNKVAGGLGEMEVVAWISALTNENNFVFNNVLVPDEHSISGDVEIDIIWLSHKLVTVVEVKAYQGKLEVHNNARWGQHVGEKNWTVKNPVDQCFRQCRLLREHFKQYKINIPVRGILAFPSVDALIIKDKPRLPLITGHGGLSNYIDTTTSMPVNAYYFRASKIIRSLDRL